MGNLRDLIYDAFWKKDNLVVIEQINELFESGDINTIDDDFENECLELHSLKNFINAVIAFKSFNKNQFVRFLTKLRLNLDKRMTL